MFSIPAEMIEQLLRQSQQGASALPIPATRSFGGFLGSQGELLPMGLFSQQAMSLANNHGQSQFVNPGPAWMQPRIPQPVMNRGGIFGGGAYGMRAP